MMLCETHHFARATASRSARRFSVLQLGRFVSNLSLRLLTEDLAKDFPRLTLQQEHALVRGSPGCLPQMKNHRVRIGESSYRVLGNGIDDGHTALQLFVLGNLGLDPLDNILARSLDSGG